MTELLLENGGQIGVPLEVARRFLISGGKITSPALDRRPIKPPTGRKVRVLAVVHGWFPGLAAGSERMMQHLLDALPRDEFEVHIQSFGVQEDVLMETEYEYEGIGVSVGLDPTFVPDVIITHHGPAARVVPTYYGQFPGVFVVAVYHNERYDIPDIQALEADLEVFNTDWVKESLGGPGIVVHPPLEADRHAVSETGGYVTLINLQANKGIRQFEALASRFPNQPFLGVIGTHGKQELNNLPPNVRVHPGTQDMREIWRDTRVLLMPSGYESYGMVAAEACVNGIPVIANPTPGLVECLDSAGLFVPRDDIDAWERTLRLLLTDPEHYRVRSGLARIRGRELASQSQTELSLFVESIRKLVRE